MRIAFLTPEFATEASFDGGLASYLDRVTAALARRGHAVEVFTASRESGRLVRRGITIHRIVPGRIVPLRLASGVLSRLGAPAFPETERILALARDLERALAARDREAPFDVVQASSYLATGLRAARRSRAPVVVRVSSYAPLITGAYCTARTPDRRLADRLEIRSVRRCRWRYAPSRFMARTWEEREGLRLEVIEPPFDLETAGLASSPVEPGETPGYLLHFGTQGRLKGSGILEEAVAPLLEEDVGLRLVLAGKVVDGEGRRLAALAERYPGRVRHLGILARDRLAPVIGGARVVALPSLVDNLPNTCLEAMALGRTVVATRGTSFEQVIEEGRSGFLVEPGDPRSLREGLRRAWGLSQEGRERIGGEARRRIDGLRPEATIPLLEDFYRRAMVEWRDGR